MLQQVDTPQNLYDSPANQFVAGFIGSPAMNLFEAKLAGSDEALAVETKAFRLDVPAKWSTVLKPYLGNEVMLGIRPEDIYVRSDLPAGISGTEVEARLEFQEMMGNEIHLHLADNGDAFVARVSPRTLAVAGEAVGLLVDTAKIHLFDRKTQAALLSKEIRAAARQQA